MTNPPDGRNDSRQFPPLPLWKKLLYGLISTIVAFALLAVVGELALRAVTLVVTSFKSAPFRRYDPEVGLALIPNMHVFHSRGCFHGEVVTNSWGMRDRERSLEKPPGEFRIALVGDSIVEAVHVKPSEVLNIQMENVLHQQGYTNIEVMAFAVEGIGTTQELVLYQKRVRQFHPDLVVVVWADNDVMNNSSVIQPKIYGIHTWYAPYYNLGPDGQLVFQPVESRPFNGLQSFLETHSLLTYYFERSWQRVEIHPATWQGVPLEFGVYGDPPDPEWTRAWTVTEKVLKLMNDTVTADGTKFIVLAAPGFLQMDPDWRPKLEKAVGKLPPSFNVNAVQEHLAAISARQGVPIDFLFPSLRAYRDSHDLKWPFFSFTCDAHFSALGHQVAAQTAVQLLQQRNLLPAVPGKGD